MKTTETFIVEIVTPKNHKQTKTFDNTSDALDFVDEYLNDPIHCSDTLNIKIAFVDVEDETNPEDEISNPKEWANCYGHANE